MASLHKILAKLFIVASCLAFVACISNDFLPEMVLSDLSFMDHSHAANYANKATFDPKFLDKKIAAQTLMLFNYQIPERMTRQPRSGLKRDPYYCSKVYEHFANNPATVFTEVNFFTTYFPRSFLRDHIIPLVGYDLMPFTRNSKIREMKEEMLEFDPYINNFYTKVGIGLRYQLGVHFACITQNYNHIKGSKHMADKDRVAANLKTYTEKYKSQPACSPGTNFFPQTWLLKNQDECKAWFDYINSPDYQTEKAQKKIVFIRKIGARVHRGKGVEPVDDDEEKYLRDLFSNGLNCGVVKDNYLVQRYINNPLLVQGHKFDFRVYMMISSVNPLIVYYHDGFLRVSLFEYDINSNEKGVHLTNTAQSEIVFKNETLQQMLGMNETELRNFQMWNYTRLAQYLISVGKIDSMNWLDDYLRPKIEHAMQHLVRMTKGHFPKKSNTWELYGVDFMLDDNLNLWFIECNIGPVIKASSEEKGEFLKKMFKDAFEIVTAQLRSRMKRVIKFINFLTTERFIFVNPEKPDEFMMENLGEHKKIYNEIIRNRIEPEFEISPENSWIKIIDESLQGTDRYNGMFPAECLDS